MSYSKFLFPLDDTLCKNCVNRMSRELNPIDLEDFDLDLSENDVEDIDNGEELIVEEHTCLILNQDMFYIVKSCTHFKNKNDVSLFSTNSFK